MITIPTAAKPGSNRWLILSGALSAQPNGRPRQNCRGIEHGCYQPGEPRLRSTLPRSALRRSADVPLPLDAPVDLSFLDSPRHWTYNAGTSSPA
jgi:hypothetical protein